MTEEARAEGAQAEGAQAEGARAFQASVPRALTITPAVDEAIRAHGQQTYPHECCGALLGRDGSVTDLVALANTTEEGPRRRFLVRPGDYRQAEQRATELGVELLGFYHSHPDHPARPSQYDLDHAWPTFAYIIVAVAEAAATAMTVWFLKDDRSSFEEGTLHHGENPHPDAAAAIHR
jgi:proteasome lid subunit RPN8/RPN11